LWYRTVDAQTILREVEARAADLRESLTRNVTQAHQVVRLVLEGRLVCQPFEEAAERGYTFTGTGTYGRLGVKTLDASNVGGGDPGGIRSGVSTCAPKPAPSFDSSVGVSQGFVSLLGSPIQRLPAPDAVRPESSIRDSSPPCYDMSWVTRMLSHDLE